jgi:hypothetical protein
MEHANSHGARRSAWRSVVVGFALSAAAVACGGEDEPGETEGSGAEAALAGVGSSAGSSGTASGSGGSGGSSGSSATSGRGGASGASGSVGGSGKGGSSAGRGGSGGTGSGGVGGTGAASGSVSGGETNEGGTSVGPPDPQPNGDSPYEIECHGDTLMCGDVEKMRCLGIRVGEEVFGYSCSNECESAADCSDAPSSSDSAAECVTFVGTSYCLLVCRDGETTTDCPNGMYCYVYEGAPIGYCLYQ